MAIPYSKQSYLLNSAASADDNFGSRFEGSQTDLYVLNTDGVSAQTLAMLQAFYSRSDMSIADRLSSLDLDSVDAALQRYYIGYGHRSIGQCGFITVFIENVSMFAANVLQHSPLYNGQETSTRYFDFESRPFAHGILATYTDKAHKALLLLYRSVFAGVCANKGVREQYEVSEESSKAANLRALRAYAFDVARGFLSPGFTTKLSWTTSLDNANVNIERLCGSTSRELRVLGFNLAELLSREFSSSIYPCLSDPSMTVDKMETMFDVVRYTSGLSSTAFTLNSSFEYDTKLIVPQSELPQDVLDVMEARLRHEPLPASYDRFGRMIYRGRIDYGSYRDLHRHRNGWVSLAAPSLFERLTIHDWYLSRLRELDLMDADPLDCGTSIGQQIDTYMTKILPEIRQAVNFMVVDDPRAVFLRYVPMSVEVDYECHYNLPQSVYISELRSARTVHPTARMFALNMGTALRQAYPRLALHMDTYGDCGPVEQRGYQTILPFTGVQS